MKLFSDIIKDAGVKSVHVVTALGNERKSSDASGMFEGLSGKSFRFGRYRSQPRRQNRRASQAETDRKAGDAKETSSLSTARYASSPDLSLDEDKDDGIMNASKSWSLPLDIKKADPDQQLIFGWASVVEKDGKAIVDKQGDVIPIVELESAAYEFVLSSRSHGDMHQQTHLGKMVESMVFTKEKQKALGIDIGQVGWWVGFHVPDEELWAAHKRGDRPEFSIGGAAVAIELKP